MEHHFWAAVALGYVHYNLCHVVRTLRVTPAMAAGIADHVWEIGELCEALLGAVPCDDAGAEAGPLAPQEAHHDRARATQRAGGFPPRGRPGAASSSGSS